MIVINAIFAASAALFVWAAVSDARRYLIPNAASLLLAGLFTAYTVTSPAGLSIPGHLLAGAAAFVVGAGLFHAGVMGGGDVKLFAAAALWAGPGLFADLLFVTALTGGLLGAAILLARRVARRAAPAPSGEAAASALQARLPYGIAIAAGGLWTLLLRATLPV
ncbi:A24 family peptidase [Azospirillum sp. sgz302134]